jgi:DNA repair exonuclease SbcCD ATPase subunit
MVAITSDSVNPSDADQSSGGGSYPDESAVESDSDLDDELEAATSSIREELEDLEQRMIAQEEALAVVPDEPVENERIQHLRRRVTELEEAFHGIMPQMEAVVHLSGLSSNGRCPVCGGSLSVEHKFTELGQPPAVTCQRCEHAVEYLAD